MIEREPELQEVDKKPNRFKSRLGEVAVFGASTLVSFGALMGVNELAPEVFDEKLSVPVAATVAIGASVATYTFSKKMQQP